MHEVTPLQKFLTETNVESLAPSVTNFVLLNTTHTIYEALQILSKNRVSSAPVLDEKGVAMGMCSVLDILIYVMQHFKDVANSTVTQGEIAEGDEELESPFELLSKGSNISKRLVGDLMWNQTAIDSYVVLSHGTSLKEALPEFADGVHRCAIMSPDGTKLVSILSQSTIVKGLAMHPDILGEDGETPIRDLAIGSSPVISAGMSEKTINVFGLMADNAVSGVAIVDHSGALLGNISAKDLAACEQNNLYGVLRQDARSFIQKIRCNSINISNPAIAVSEDATLNTVLLKLAGNGIHRIFVCNKEQKPIRVISLRDILEFIYDISDSEGMLSSEGIQIRDRKSVV